VDTQEKVDREVEKLRERVDKLMNQLRRREERVASLRTEREELRLEKGTGDEGSDRPTALCESWAF